MKALFYLMLIPLFAMTGIEANENPPTTWQFLKSTDHIEIYVADENFTDVANGIFFNYKVFKFVNLSRKNVQATWDFDVEYSNGSKRSIYEEEIEGSGRIKLSPGQTYLSSSYKEEDKHLVIFDKVIDFPYSTLVEFDLKNLKSEEIQ